MKITCLTLTATAALLLAAAACSGPSAPVRAAEPAGVTVIRNGTLIDGTGAAPIANSAVIVQGERITAVGREADLELPAGAQTVDAGGGTILPGLIDSHVHSAWSPRTRRPFLKLGVTSVCDLGTFEEDRLGDIPIVDGDAATDLAALENVRTVVMGGQAAASSPE